MDGEEYLSPVNSYLGARTKLKISVTNTGTAPVSNVLACSTLANPTCETVGTLAPGATAVRTHEFQMPKTPTNLESVATAEAPDLGVSPTSLLRIGARCEPLIVELDPNPNPIFSTIKTGGRVVRHYMAVHPVSNLPARGVSLALQGSLGTSVAGYTFTSGDDGMIDTRIGPSARLLDGLALPARPTGQMERWTLRAVNDVPVECGRSFGFDVQSLTVFPYTQSIEAGSGHPHRLPGLRYRWRGRFRREPACRVTHRRCAPA